MKKTTTQSAATTMPALPAGIVAADLVRPKWNAKGRNAAAREGGAAFAPAISFELWYVTTLGWCIPTLLIRNPGRRSTSTNERTYATTMAGEPVRIGLGPHVLHRVRVYVREGRRATLQKYVELQHAGEVTANEIRDRISSRRAQTAARRRFF